MDKKKEIENKAQFYIDKMETDRCKDCNDFPCKCNEDLPGIGGTTFNIVLEKDYFKPSLKENIFNIEELTTRLLKVSERESTSVKQGRFMIGIDSYKDTHVYCLTRLHRGVFEVFYTKASDNKKEFDKEVKNLSKYFNAIIIKEV